MHFWSKSENPRQQSVRCTENRPSKMKTTVRCTELIELEFGHASMQVMLYNASNLRRTWLIFVCTISCNHHTETIYLHHLTSSTLRKYL
jgi:hypothetical protein